MTKTVDALIIGGGPAGSTCAWKLRRAGMNVVVLDRAVFPRDKVCAGWITPQVVDDLQLDLADYARGRTLQAFNGFRVGLIDGHNETETRYDETISFGIRRCEFDHYLLMRSGATLRLGEKIADVRRDGDRWTINDSMAAPLLIGAGGHFCPIARTLNGGAKRAPVVAAQETEFVMDASHQASIPVAGERPELYFSRDLKGYGWCVRKQSVLNVGFGHISEGGLPEATAGFVAFLKDRGRIPEQAAWKWKGHAYLLSEPPSRQVIGDGVLLIGDAAGLAYPQSGEGIRPAIESALLAAEAVIDARGRYTVETLKPYERRLRERFGATRLSKAVQRALPASAGERLAPWLMALPWFVRHIVLDRWFLHRDDAPLDTRDQGSGHQGSGHQGSGSQGSEIRGRERALA